MKKSITVIALFTISLVLVGCTVEEPLKQVESDEEYEQTEQIDEEKEVDEEVIQLAEVFIEELSNDQYEQAAEKFDETMQEQLGAEDLEQLWESVEEQLGAYIEHEYDQTETVDGYDVILINGIFHNAEATFQVTVSENQEIAGFYIQ